MSKCILKSPLARACTALATLTGLLASAPSQAVSLSQDGQGQVLLYPYYTVRGGTDTYLSLLNSTNEGKVLSVRLREGRNGRSVLQFRVFLGPSDQWTAGITRTAEGAKLFSTDSSCTSLGNLSAGVELSDDHYSGDLVPGFQNSGGDGAGTGLDRTREGSIEIIELGQVASNLLWSTISAREDAAPECDARWLTMEKAPDGTAPLIAPTGRLTGSGSLINVEAGTEYSYEPVALGDFSEQSLWSATDPDLSLANPRQSQVVNGKRMITSTWSRGQDAVSAVLMAASVYNELVLEPTTLSGTDWVVNMPTKHHYVPVTGAAEIRRTGPFETGFVSYQHELLSGKCTINRQYSLTFLDRKGHSFSDRPDLEYIRLMQIPDGLCWQSNVLTFNDSNLLASANSTAVSTSVVNGLAVSDLSGSLVSLEGHGYQGLPVIGFMLRNFTNGNVNGALSNYGGNFDHKYGRDVTAP